MSKLVRLLGDSTQHSTEIRNNFVDPVTLTPNSKIALRSAHMDINDTVDQEEFPCTDETLQIGKKGSELTVTIPDLTYPSGNSLLVATQKACNSVGTALGSTNSDATHYDILSKEDGHIKIESYSVRGDDADFESWDIVDGTGLTFPSDKHIEYDGLSDEDIVLQNVNKVPLSNNVTEFVLNSLQVFKWFYCPHDDPTDKVFGMSFNGTQVHLYDNNSIVATSTHTFLGTELLIMQKYGNQFRLKIYNSTTLALLETVGAVTLSDAALTPQSLYGTITADRHSTFGLEDCEDMAISPESGLSHDASLIFGSKKLATFFGFKDTDYEFSGDPAELISQNPMKGILGYPAIMVAIDALNLESYIGKQAGRVGTSSIISVIPHEGTAEVRYVPNYPLYLNINNSETITLYNMSVRFLRELNSPPIKFMGKPMITLEIVS